MIDAKRRQIARTRAVPQISGLNVARRSQFDVAKLDCEIIP
jgi:hypothetical protein